MAKLGSKAGWSGNYVESVSAAKTITMGDSGKVFMLANAGAIAITLPDISAMSAQEKESAIGWNASFICQQTPGGAAVVGCSAGDANILFGSVVGADGGAGTGLDAAADDVTFTTGAVAGDMAKVFYDGTYYYAQAQCADVAHITVD